MKKLLALTAMMLAMSAAPVEAALVTSSANFNNATTTVFSTVAQGLGPANLNGFTVTGTGAGFFAADDRNYGLTTNGNWTNFGFLGLFTNESTLTIDLGASYGSVGAFLNYSGVRPIARLIALDSNLSLLESYNLVTDAPIVTPNGSNDGAFRGISRSSADIRYLCFESGFMVAHSITLGDVAVAAPVPEPVTWAMLITGFGLIGGVARRRRASAVLA